MNRCGLWTLILNSLTLKRQSRIDQQVTQKRSLSESNRPTMADDGPAAPMVMRAARAFIARLSACHSEHVC